MATFVAVTEREFVNQVFAAVPESGIQVGLTVAGRQLNFSGNVLAEGDLRRVFQDIEAKTGVYSQADMMALLGGSQAPVIQPFFDLVTQAGLAVVSTDENGNTVYRFALSNRVS